MASGWNLWVWLQCIGVASQCCYKKVYIDILIIIINFPYSTCISTSGVGKINNYYEDIYIYLLITTLTSHTYTL